ncbi:LysR substrate-binding domain-containing protein [Salinarimonas chemoclinalis]|uniref:LysR substrate-binding domain-containing protein n=1 Tax=Salinarimonas chemoclinalis TaxID=3241599 RepID=UPI00355709D2
MTPAILRRLEIFCAVIEAGGATQAATRLSLSQPAVSQQIARLEEELGLALFARANGRLSPTESALVLYEEASHAFDGLERVVNLARDIRGLERGLLRIAAPHSMAAALLPRALERLAAGRDRLRFDVRLGRYETIVGMVAAREVDLGIAKAPLLAPGVEAVEIGTSGLVAVAAASSPLAARPVLRLADLASEPLIMIGRGRPWRDEIDVAFRRRRLPVRVAVETQSVASAIGFAAAGFGVALTPDWFSDAMAREDVVIRPVDIDILHRFLVVHPARAGSRALAEAFAEAIRAVRAQMPGGPAVETAARIR